MINLVVSLAVASLLIPTGFNFFSSQAVDNSFIGDQNSSQAPQRTINKSFGLKTTADNILVVDDESSAVLYQRDPAEIVPIASITKLMTALVFLDTDPDWDEVVTMQRSDQRLGGQIYLLTGEQILVSDLFYLMLSASSNEAAAALSRVSGIENFSSAMNKKAAELGMTDTFFLEETGLSEENVSTARDLIKLADAAFSREEINRALKTNQFNFLILNNGRRGQSRSTDRLLESFLNSGEYEIIGAKTGFLNEAGYCLLIKVKKQDGPVLTLALLGADQATDRWQETKGLVDWTLDNYIWSSN